MAGTKGEGGAPAGQDIVHRLRRGLSANDWVSEELAHAAADEIERLRKELAAKDLTIARLVDELTGDEE